MAGYMTMPIEPGKAIEITRTGGRDDGRLVGYAIFFSGGWDGWWLTSVGFMERVCSNVSTPEEAIKAVLGE